MNRKDSPLPRTYFHPEELSRIFMDLYHRGVVQGIFLSSATGPDPLFTMKNMLKTCQILRERYKFTGYLHLKILPFAPFSYIEEAISLANRVSINLESPNGNCLSAIAPDKNWSNLWGIIKAMKEIAERKASSRVGITTQFIVGPGGEKDKDLVSLAYNLYRHYRLKRVYYSAFTPLPSTPLSKYPSTSPLREYRLYQVDALIRYYGFSSEEIVFEEGNLNLTTDPKLLWALRHPEFFPVEINRAPFSTLIRVPGIGPAGAKKIIERRIKEKIRKEEDLKGLRIRTGIALPFILLDGRIYRR
ncbi:MAG: putative DNA modification/repair radical SAM protein [Caldiserica bacterium]|nr:putative DNA modification/repair radical SAM protein [Caldisericota bacterium]